VDGVSAALETKAAIRDQALALGFDAVGFAAADLAAETSRRFRQFLDEGMHGDMGWLAAHAERRAAPRALWPEAKSVVLLALNYAPDHDPMDNLAAADRGNISVYARHRDYHDLLKKKLRQLAGWMAQRFGTEVKLFVDTAPVLEKPLAAAAGIGWQGKHTNLVSRGHGSWLFLGEIFTALDLAPDAAEEDHCGSCRNCLDICPTKAFPAPYRLDARRCISYLTIEHKGHIAEEFRVPMGNRIYGCDDCLAVCPWNKFSSPTREPALLARADLTAPLLADLSKLDDAGFRALFSGSPVKRIGRDRFVRNVLIAIGNSGTPALASDAEALLADPSPLVRAMAVWALKRLDEERFTALRLQHLGAESNQAVRNEWDLAS